MQSLPVAKKPTKISIAEAKAKFAAFSRRAEQGETIVITRHGKDIAVLGPAIPQESSGASLLGAWRDRPVRIADDFDEPGPEWDEYTRG